MKSAILKTAATAALLAALIAPAQAQVSASAEPVTFRYMGGLGSITAFELADRLGYFESTPVRFENVGLSKSGPESLMALVSDTIDIAIPATPAYINAVAAGNDLLVAYPGQGINDEVYSVFYVPEASPIKTVTDLAGKTVAVNALGAHLDYVVREALEQASLPEDAVTLITVPDPQLNQVLRSEQVDVSAYGFWSSTFAGVAAEAGGLREVFRDTDILGELAGSVVTLRGDFARAHPEAVEAFITQSARAMAYADEHRAETQAILADLLRERSGNPDIAQHFKGYGVRPSGLATPRDLTFWTDILTREGKLQPDQLDAASLLIAADDSAKSK